MQKTNHSDINLTVFSLLQMYPFMYTTENKFKVSKNKFLELIFLKYFFLRRVYKYKNVHFMATIMFVYYTQRLVTAELLLVYVLCNRFLYLINYQLLIIKNAVSEIF